MENDRAEQEARRRRYLARRDAGLAQEREANRELAQYLANAGRFARKLNLTPDLLHIRLLLIYDQC